MAESPFDQRGQKVERQIIEVLSRSRLVEACEELLGEYRSIASEPLPGKLRQCIKKIEKLIQE